MDVEFSDLTYTISKPTWRPGKRGPEKKILKGISGSFKSGELTAILGHSGAGKSSLLDILAGVTTEGVGGALLTNGQARDNRVFLRSSCYLMQEDLLQPLMTLRELMEFAAVLKLPVNTTLRQREEKVKEIIATLNLLECENTRTETLSGGQKKRLSIGLELLNNPPVFLLDEPTSGLDNVSAMQCLRLLRGLAHEGRTIVCSIHQPSALLFQQFDHVYVMSQGLCVYQGPTTHLVSFLDAAGLPCSITHNPADFVVEATDEMGLSNVEILSTLIANGKTVWKGGTEIITRDSSYDKTITNGNLNTSKTGDSEYLQHSPESLKIQENCKSEMRISSLYQFCMLISRMFLQIRRNKTSLWIQLFHHIACGVLIGLLFFNRANDGNDIFTHIKFIMSILVFHAYTHMFVPILSYPLAVKVLKREYLNRWYRFGPYYFALNLAVIPTKIFFSLIFLTIVYFMWGLPADVIRFFCFCTIGVLTSLVSEGLGYVIGSHFSMTNGTAIGPACLAAMLGTAIFGFDYARQVPGWLHMLLQVSFLRLGLISMITTIYGMDRAYLVCPDAKFGYCHFQNPKNILYWSGMDTNTVPLEMLKFLAMTLFYRGLFFITLRRRLRK